MSLMGAIILGGCVGLLAMLWGIYLGIEIGRDREWFNSTFTRHDTNSQTTSPRKRRRN